MSQTPSRQTGGTPEQAPKADVMSHEQKPRPTLARLLESSKLHRQRFWNLYTTLRRVERGEI